MSLVGERFIAVRNKAVAAYQQATGLTTEPHIVCVTKTQPIDNVREVLEAGATEIGENYLQEAVRKDVFGLRRDWSVRLHFIGRLQSNKYNPILRMFDAVDSSDQPFLEKVMERGQDPTVQASTFLLEVNAGGETQKGGLTVTEVRALVAVDVPWLRRLNGLMAVVPLAATMAERARMYDSVHELYCDLAHQLGAAQFSLLSMGTSDDYELALAHGSNMVRIGTAIFGPRTCMPV
ncbi:MAG TPA: YggS family pyridoxal phosphate-dependent enzyme [Candidatus Cryosericum sp.]|nr:YggS family pyridoxal phosphate-dependent enzyme [Candidatus Cryosericum sp.]